MEPAPVGVLLHGKLMSLVDTWNVVVLRGECLLFRAGLAESDAERALVGKERRHAAGMQEDDILVLAPSSLADQGDQAGKPLPRIDRIKR